MMYSAKTATDVLMNDGVLKQAHGRDVFIIKHFRIFRVAPIAYCIDVSP